MSSGAALAISFVLLIGNAYFVGAEFAAMAARRSRLEPLAQAGGRRARACLEAMEQLATVLVAAQLGITICSVGIGALAETAFEHLLAPVFAAVGLPGPWDSWVALGLALLVVVYLHVTVGEMIPKNLAIAGPERAALLLVPPLLYLARALRGIVAAMSWLARGAVRMLGVAPREEIASGFTAEEVAHIVAESRRVGLILDADSGLVSNTLQFRSATAHQVAVPLEGLVTIDESVTPAQLERLVAKYGFSRYPVRDDNGQVAAYLHLKDVLSSNGAGYDEPVPLHRLRRLATVSPGDELGEVLATMRRTSAHLARVVDATGSVAGVIFLEDVLELLVGEVTDASQR